MITKAAITGKRFPLLLLALLVMAGCGGGASEQKGPGPNIILISLDTLRADHLRCYGYDKETSPAMDRMAAEGVLFENVYAQSNWTLPSHVSMFSSLYPSSHGVLENKRKISGDTVLLPELLKDAGYATASFNAGGYVSAGYGFNRGFDIYRTIPKGRGTVEDICGRAIRWIRKNGARRFFLFLHTYEVHKPYAAPAPYLAQYALPEKDAVARIDAVLYKVLGNETLSFHDYECLAAYTEKCTGQEMKEILDGFYQTREAEIKGKYGLSWEAWVQRLSKVMRTLPEKYPEVYDYWHEQREAAFGYRYLLGHYDAEIRFVDDQIARLRQFLEAEGLLDGTVIFITSDHGEEFADHRNLGHRLNCYNEVIRVPLIVFGPGLFPAGVRISAGGALIDLPPTILDLAGLEGSDAFQGLSLLPLIDGGEPPSRSIFSEHILNRREPGYRPVAVIHDEWKYQCNIDALGFENLYNWDLGGKKQRRGFMARIEPEELYHLGEDPGERVNRVESSPREAERMKRMVIEHLRQVRERPAESIVPDEDLESQLRNLGYID
jgi:arylsulfatase A-like enzyme